MALCSEVDHIVEVVLCEESSDKFFVADVALNKDVPWIAFTVFQVFKISCIGECVKVDEQNIIVLL